MDFEIIESVIPFRLYGLSSAVDNSCYGEVGLRLMNTMWKVVNDTGLKSTGINHWVYLADGSMFVGVALLDESQPSSDLELYAFELHRYLKHVHVGTYQALPEKWAALKTEIAACGETIGAPSLEVYGHHCEDTSKLETTILISLNPKA